MQRFVDEFYMDDKPIETTAPSGLDLAACISGLFSPNALLGMEGTFLFILSSSSLDSTPPAWPS